MKFYKIFLPAALLAACNNNPVDPVAVDNTNPPPASITYSVIKIYPHDTASYTQGLLWQQNKLYESTGLEGQSKLMIENIEDGTANKQLSINPVEFGEGITIFNNKIYQLTWKDHVVHVYDAATFKKLQDLVWPYEGWGITNNGKELIISTGSSNLYYVNADSFTINKIIGVFDNYGPTGDLNELEYIKGSVYANQYGTDYILKINPETGKIEGKMDLAGLLAKSGKNFDPQMYDSNTGNVLNGIAYDSAKNSLYITGKKWPALFEIKLNE